ncbi:MAG TPA: hypothetical protein VN932_09775 [Rhizomicrobium sp.]|nr:hypothetical protein [Rhizomicrobium sp.]
MTKWLVRIVGLAVALGITAGVLLFYGEFAMAMRHAMEVPAVRPASAPANPGEVTVTIISQPARKQVCGKDKQHPCPPFP